MVVSMNERQKVNVDEIKAKVGSGMEKAEAFTTQIIQAWRNTFEWVADSIPGLLRDAEVSNMTFRCGNGYYELLKAIAENKVPEKATVFSDVLITDFCEGFAYGIMLSLSEWNEDDSDRRVDAFLTRVSLDGELRIFAEGSWEETCGVFEYVCGNVHDCYSAADDSVCGALRRKAWVRSTSSKLKRYHLNTQRFLFRKTGLLTVTLKIIYIVPLDFQLWFLRQSS